MVVGEFKDDLEDGLEEDEREQLESFWIYVQILNRVKIHYFQALKKYLHLLEN